MLLNKTKKGYKKGLVESWNLFKDEKEKKQGH